jgi:exodeoxyribonuclease VII large subunit
VDELSRRLNATILHSITLQQAQLAGIEQRLTALNPMAVLDRGYALVTQPDGGLVTSAVQVNIGDALRLRLKDGSLSARVEAKDEQEEA